MKYYLLESTSKRSVSEQVRFKRKDENGNLIHLTRDEIYKWGSWRFSIPETAEEIEVFLHKYKKNTMEDFIADYLDINDIIVDFGMLEKYLLPDAKEGYVLELTERYKHAELLECEDPFGLCNWVVSCTDKELELKYKSWEQKAEKAELYPEELGVEDWEDFLDTNGWENVGAFYILTNGCEIKPCNEQGEI